tara:strand:+ start:697 stop:801 length:105 start_codon:yes stop_codon:yes gene_type:complete
MMLFNIVVAVSIAALISKMYEELVFVSLNIVVSD